MPAFTWVNVEPNGSPLGRAASTRVYSRAIDPTTGDAVFDRKTRSWAASPSPLGTKLALCLRTAKGAAARDPGYGVDLSQLERSGDAAASVARGAIADALARYRAEMRGAPVIDVEVRGELVLFAVTFTDALGRAGGVRGGT